MLKFKSHIQNDNLLLLSQSLELKAMKGLYNLFVDDKDHLYHFLDMNNKISFEGFCEQLTYKQTIRNLYLYTLYEENGKKPKAVFEIKYSLSDNLAFIRWYSGKQRPNPKLLSRALKIIVSQILSLGCRKIVTHINSGNAHDIALCEDCGFRLEALLRAHQFDYNSENFADVAVFSQINQV